MLWLKRATIRFPKLRAVQYNNTTQRERYSYTAAEARTDIVNLG